MGEHAAARRAREVHAPELGALDAGDPVVPGQALVQERVAAVDEVEEAPVLAHQALEEELGLPAHRVAQVVLEVGEAVPVGGDRLEGAELQPLAAEGLDEGARLGVGSIRRTCASSVRGPRRRLRSARPRSSSSGALAQRK